MEETAFRFSPEERAQLARLLIDCGAYQRGSFTLASGKTSDTYIDVKRGITRPDILALVANAMAPHIDSDRIAGVELAGVPIAAAVCLAVDRPCIYVRKQAKEHGTKSRIEGELKAGDSVTFVEDVTTTGGSALKAVETARDAGAEIALVFTMVDRQEGAAETFAAAGIKFEALFKAEEFLRG